MRTRKHAMRGRMAVGLLALAVHSALAVTPAPPSTTAPATDAPVSTEAPQTDAPTPAPATPSPTAAPATGAPATEVPTDAPTTLAPTAAPGTAAPTTTTAPDTAQPTGAPGSLAPTDAPTTLAPTAAPGTAAPTTTTAPDTAQPTGAPGTLAPTDAPTTLAPTAAPATISPTGAPTTVAPASTTAAPAGTPAPITPAPTDIPVTDAPAGTTIAPTDIPVTDTPAGTTIAPTDIPVTDAPAGTTIAPTDVPVTDTPAGTTIAPTDAPTTGNPATSSPGAATAEPSTADPATSAPAVATDAPAAQATLAPDTDAPATGAPASGAPNATDAPTTAAPATGAPATTAPSTAAPTGTTGVPVTDAPADGNATITTDDGDDNTTGVPATDAPAAVVTVAPNMTEPVTTVPTTLVPTVAPPTDVPPTDAPRGRYPESRPVTLRANQDIETFDNRSFARSLHSAMRLDDTIAVASFNARAGSVLVDNVFYSLDGTHSVVELNVAATRLELEADNASSPLREAMPSISGTGEHVSDDDLTSGEVAAIVICALFFALILPLGILIAWYTRKQREGEDAEKYEPQDTYEMYQQVAAALAQAYGSVEQAVDLAHSDHKKDEKSLDVKGVKFIMDAAQVGQHYDKFIASVAVKDDAVTREELLRVLKKTAHPPADAGWENLRAVYARAKGASGEVTCLQLSVALQQDPQALKFTEPGCMNAGWGDAVMADIQQRPQDGAITWEDFEEICRTAMVIADGQQDAAAANENPLRNMEPMDVQVFEKDTQVEALFEGSWFPAAILERMLPGDDPDFPDGGYNVLWLEDSTTSKLRMYDVRAVGAQDEPVPIETRAVDDMQPQPVDDPHAHYDDQQPVDPADVDVAVAEAPAAGVYAEGEKVSVFFDDGWYDGYVIVHNADGTYDIDWRDGQKSLGIVPEHIRPADGA